MPEIVNSIPGIHWQVSVDKQGNLYFGASGEKGSRIYYSELKRGEYSKPRILEGLQYMEAFSPYIAPDGTYLIVTNPEKGENLYILYKKKDGNWSEGKELSNYIGIKYGFCPIVTSGKVPHFRFLCRWKVCAFLG